MSNTSATGGVIPITDRGATLSDEALEDLLHDWIAALTALDPTQVRPAYQPDLPPIPDFTTPCWCAFFITRTANDWDPVVQHWSQDTPPGLGDTVFRNQRIEMTLTFYGAAAGNVALDFRMATGIRQNTEMLGDFMALVSVEEQAVTSEQIKGRWQRRVDVRVVLRRAVQFTYGVLDVGAAYGTIYSDSPPIDFNVTPDSNTH